MSTQIAAITVGNTKQVRMRAHIRIGQKGSIKAGFKSSHL